MNLEVMGSSAFQYLKVVLEPGESFVSEAGKMVRHTAGVETDVSVRAKGKGGVLGALKRAVSGDSFFIATYTAAGGGEVFLAPDLMGEVSVVELDGQSKWMCTGASYMGGGPDVEIDTKFQGVKGLFSGESLFFVEAGGTGPLVVNGFGAINEIAVDGSYVVDSGHVIAFETSLDYEITKAGASWIHSFLAGEGFVMKFNGHGRVLVQSHNPGEFGKLLGPKLPPRA